MPDRVLDVGCGSGILALAALRLGAGSAVGIDTDPLAVTASRENAERNGLADRFEAREGTLPATADERYPLVLANLVAAVLVELAGPLAAHLAPGGTLLASGIIEPRAAEVEDAMLAAGLARRRAPPRRRVGLVAAGAAGMTLHRFFVAPDALDGDRFPLPASIERQVRGVLRMADGDRLVLLPGDGSQALCRLDGAECVVEERSVVASEPRHRLTVVQALLKGDALEEVVQHATEIGVAAFQLVVTERCVAREISPRKLERLRAIAREAAEQSERGIVPPDWRAGAAPGRARRRIGPALRAARRRTGWRGWSRRSASSSVPREDSARPR